MTAKSAADALRRNPTATVLIAGVLLGVVLGVLSNFRGPWTFVAIIVAVLAAGLVVTRTLGAALGMLVLLIITTFLDRFTFPVGRLDVRAEQIAAVLALAVVLSERFREPLGSWLRPSLVELLVVAWFAVALVSSLVVAPDRGHSLKVLALLAVSAVALFLPRRMLGARRELVEPTVGWLLLALVAESA